MLQTKQPATNKNNDERTKEASAKKQKHSLDLGNNDSPSKCPYSFSIRLESFQQNRTTTKILSKNTDGANCKLDTSNLCSIEIKYYF